MIAFWYVGLCYVILLFFYLSLMLYVSYLQRVGEFTYMKDVIINKHGTISIVNFPLLDFFSNSWCI